MGTVHTTSSGLSVSFVFLFADLPDYLGPNHQLGKPPAIHVRDARLTLIQALGIDFKGLRCCDVGSNDGNVATQLGMYLCTDTVRTRYVRAVYSIIR